MKQICAPTISTFFGNNFTGKTSQISFKNEYPKIWFKNKGGYSRATMSNEIYSHLKIIPQI